MQNRASSGVTDSRSPSCALSLMVTGVRLALALSIPSVVVIP